MTVKELIDELSKLPDTYVVGADDCTIFIYDSAEGDSNLLTQFHAEA